MSALPQRGGHSLGGMFSGGGGGVTPLSMSSLPEHEQQESRVSHVLGSKKKRRAPPPPTSGLGHYKPKILSQGSPANVPVNRHSVRFASTENISAPAADSKANGGEGGGGDADGGGGDKPYVDGDKYTPLMLHSSSDLDLDHRVSELSLSRETDGGEAGGVGTDNPLYQPNEEDGEEEEEAAVPNGHTPNDSPESPVAQNGEPEGVYIPEPDYDEEEKTMVLSDDDDDEEDGGVSSSEGKKVYKEYYGEDFAQYLSDEDFGPDTVPRRNKRSSLPAVRRAGTEAKRPHYKKRHSLTGKGKERTLSGSNSLRTFSFADSKFGTVQGSSGKRHSVPSVSEDGPEEAELFVSTGSSYEQFLRSKNGEELDVFQDQTVEENEAELPDIPRRYSGPTQKKDTLWKKLTWRFKKQSRNSLDITS